MDNEVTTLTLAQQQTLTNSSPSLVTSTVRTVGDVKPPRASIRRLPRSQRHKLHDEISNWCASRTANDDVALNCEPASSLGSAIANEASHATSQPGNSFDRLHFSSPLQARVYDTDSDAERCAELNTPLPPNFPSAVATAHKITQQVIEILNGHRPPRHLQTWMLPNLYQSLVRRAALATRILGGPERTAAPHVRRVRVFHPLPRVAEVAVVVFDGRRIRAVAIRLQARRSQWHVTALEVV